MIFVVIIGGIGSIEGPIVGTIIYVALQKTLAPFGAWYFIVVGLVAIVIALWSPRGVWGCVAGRFHLHPFPIGYWLWATDGRLPTTAPAAGAPRRRTTTDA